MTNEDGLLGAAALRRALERHGVRPLKSLGQNFVIDPNTIRKVLSAAHLPSNTRVLEVGAGAGSLTLALAGACEYVVALEKDARLLPVLHEVVGDCDNVEIVQGDALEVDLASFRTGHVVANLPYNVAATVVIRVLDEAPSVQSLTVMTQREVGERLAAGPGSKVYGQTSVLVAHFASASVVGTVSRRAFFPVPRVDSVIVRVERREGAELRHRAEFFQVVKAAFSQRRKTLRNSVAGLFDSSEESQRAFYRAGVDPSMRAETLTADAFALLAEELARSGRT
ncbi:MAG: 16S rRNA (adenine(1518)-N(6)/adenine(1519)-N(6))-dimethyltransferase RsmA [Actinomycetota bacterium]|nr:16S rRNA (adenine(1518)-N(6)/adenine(1519)-N(6))-dimethyltransferase RsmA [Actinomycetota bacterium]